MDVKGVREKIQRNMPRKPESRLKWKQISPTCLQSECKRFSVGKFCPGSEIRYRAWYRKTIIASFLETAQAAKDACELYVTTIEKEEALKAAEKARRED